MDLTNLANLKEIGIAMAAIMVFGYICKYVIDTNKGVFDSLIVQLKENRDDYSQFVESNNHGNTERIEKSTEAITKVADAIDRHNQVLERLITKLDK